MQELTLAKQNDQYVVDSRQVAEMVGKQHNNLMRDIDGYVRILESSKMSSQDFFIPNSYKVNGNNKTRPCYLLIKKGCEMDANKMTGEKGVLFTDYLFLRKLVAQFSAVKFHNKKNMTPN